MRPEERHCAILVDEMQLTPGLDFDPTEKAIIGQATAPLSRHTAKDPCLASHGLVVMLAGLSSRWKQVMAYHFSGDSVDGSFLKDFIFEVIKKCEAVGAQVDAVISDMGPSNKALWKLCGIGATRASGASVSCSHPYNVERRLYFLADPPHILKNHRGHLVRGQCIRLPPDVVKAQNLPCDQVSVRHIRKVAEIDADHELKLAPHLKLRYLDPSHYEKMNVSSAVAVLNHAVAAAIRVLVDKWFCLMSSRSVSTGLSHFKENKHQDAVDFLDGFARLMSTAGIMVSSVSAVQLQEFFLKKQKFNIFAPSRKGSYQISDRSDLLEFVELTRGLSQEDSHGTQGDATSAEAELLDATWDESIVTRQH
ncbi:uncharacterized protein LOC135370557 [Ornithodoros turicata]|uniref:uncharacterized protein LOC135370557 n=1 Tax=Ornithodoros turicata TaxID=34597 RepID=UPI0031398663